MGLKLSEYRLAIALAACGALSGCFALNSVGKLPTGGAPWPERSVLVYGIQVEGQWRAPRWAVGLDEYSLARQEITGNCWRYNRTEASVPSASRDVHFFAFDVPEGYYAFSGFSRDRPEAPVAFFAPRGRTVLVGVFAYTSAGKVVLHRDLAAQRPLVEAQLPRLSGETALAESVAIQRAPGLFICTP